MNIMRPIKEKIINSKKEYAKRYLLKYLKELKVHFDMTDDEIKAIMREVYYSKTALYNIIRKTNKFLRNRNGS